MADAELAGYVTARLTTKDSPMMISIELTLGVHEITAKEAIRDLYNQPDHTTAKQYLAELIDLFADTGFGAEVNSLGRTLSKWGTQMTNWYKAKVSNRRLRTPTEAANNLIKRVKRVGFGFRNFDNYRTRVLLYAGKPDWDLLDTIKPPQIR